MINSIETLKSGGGKSRSLTIQLRSGRSFFYSTVDTGSPVSFLNKRTCDLLLQRNPSIEFRDIARYPDDTLYVDYNKQPNRLLGSIQIPISSSGWRVDNAQFFISENRALNLLGLDLQEQLGVVPTQLKAESVQSLEYNSSDPISEYWSSFFAKKYAHVFSRLGRSKHHKVYTNFKFPLVMEKCTTDFFIAPIVLTAKKDGSIKLAPNAKPMNARSRKTSTRCRTFMNSLIPWHKSKREMFLERFGSRPWI